MEKILFLFTLTTLSVAAYGQAANDYKKNSLGLDLAPIVQNMAHSDSLIPYSITYRRYIMPNHALRLRVDFGYKNTNLKYPRIVSSESDSTMNFYKMVVGLGLGYERSMPLLPWLSFRYGGDISYRWLEREDKAQYITHTRNNMEYLVTYYHDNRRIYPERQLMVQPFIGAVADIFPAVSIAVDFSVGYRYAHSTNRHVHNDPAKIEGVDVILNGWTKWPGSPREVNSHSTFSTVAVNLFYNF